MLFVSFMKRSFILVSCNIYFEKRTKEVLCTVRWQLVLNLAARINWLRFSVPVWYRHCYIHQSKILLFLLMLTYHTCVLDSRRPRYLFLEKKKTKNRIELKKKKKCLVQEKNVKKTPRFFFFFVLEN